MDRATFVADTRDWDFRWTQYYWINGSNVLFFRSDYPKQRSKNGWDFFERDIVTGRESYLSALSQLANRSFGVTIQRESAQHFEGIATIQTSTVGMRGSPLKRLSRADRIGRPCLRKVER